MHLEIIKLHSSWHWTNSQRREWDGAHNRLWFPGVCTWCSSPWTMVFWLQNVPSISSGFLKPTHPSGSVQSTSEKACPLAHPFWVASELLLYWGYMKPHRWCMSYLKAISSDDQLNEEPLRGAPGVRGWNTFWEQGRQLAGRWNINYGCLIASWQIIWPRLLLWWEKTPAPLLWIRPPW